MKKEPLVTVLMSVYNGEKFLCEAIESILNQSFEDFEFLIINDGSIDASREIILRYDDPRINLVDNYKNLGLIRSLNKGISLAKGKYIARMDADDISMPGRLEKQVEFMDANEQVAVCGARGILINENGQKVGDIAPNAYTSEEIDARILIMNQFIHPAVMLRKKCILDIGGYNKKANYAEDYRMWVDLLINNHKLYNLKSVLIKYRIHEESVSVKKREKQEDSACKIIQYGLKKLYKKHFSLKDIKLMRKVYFYNDQSITDEELDSINDKFGFLLLER